MSEAFIQSNTFDASIGRVYSAIANADEHAAFTGAPATGSIEPGTRFTTHGGAIEGWTLGTETNEYIVQAWRPADWAAGVYSLVRYDFAEANASTILTLTHSSVPDGTAIHLEQGWNDRYWPQLAEHLAGQS